ncbi:MAG: hypothetical protein IKC53_11525, partial [Lentisphaeria bacterium]|nr:hypothetical protein [Lentisphaeria bacterium]
LFQKVEPEDKKPEQKADSKPEAKTADSVPETAKTADEKPVEEKPAAKPAESAKPVQSEAKPESAAKPEEKPSAPEAKKPEPAPAEEKKPEPPKPEHHSASQFEFRMPTLVVNYGKKPNASFTVGQAPLKAPEQHPLPEPLKPAPAKSFKASEKLHLDVKISTASETGDAPVISLHAPVKAEKTVSAPARKKPVQKAAPKNFRPAKTQKLQVKVSSAAQLGDTSEKKPPRKTGATSAKKGK